MPKITSKYNAQFPGLEIPVIGCRSIEKHLSWISLKGAAQSIFLMIAKDTRDWKTGAIKKITMTNNEIARQFHYSGRTVQRCTQLLLKYGYIKKHTVRKKVAENVLTFGNQFMVPD